MHNPSVIYFTIGLAYLCFLLAYRKRKLDEIMNTHDASDAAKGLALILSFVCMGIIWPIALSIRIYKLFK